MTGTKNSFGTYRSVLGGAGSHNRGMQRTETSTRTAVIGTFALALGLGLAVASNPVVALAEPTDADASTEASDVDTDGPEPETAPEPDGEEPEDPEPDATEVDATEAEPTSDDEPPSDVSDPSPSPPVEAEPTSTDNTGHRDRRIDDDPEPAVDVDSPEADTPEPPVAAEAAVEEPILMLQLTGPPAPHLLVTETSTTRIAAFDSHSETTPAPVAAPEATLISRLATTFGLAPMSANGPVRPADSPILWAVLAWVRRQFFNSTPTLVVEQPSVGLLAGDVDAVDVDGDAVRFSIEQSGAPANGTAVIDGATGEWTYTPDPGYVGVDEFTVTATESSVAHWHGLLSFLRPHSVHNDHEVIRVMVVEEAPDPVVDEIHGANPGGIALSGDGRYGYVLYGRSAGHLEERFAVVDMVTNSVVREIPLGQATVNEMIIASDGGYAYVVNERENLTRVIDLDPTSTTAYTEVDRIDYAVSGPVLVAADGRSYYFVGDMLAADVDPTQEGEPGSFSLYPGVPISAPALTSDGRRLLVQVPNVGETATLVVSTDPTDAGATTLIPTPGATEIVVSSDGAHAFVLHQDPANADARVLTIVDTDPDSPAHDTVIATVLLNSYAGAVSASADGTRTYVTHSPADFETQPDYLVGVVDTDPTSATYLEVIADVPVSRTMPGTPVLDDQRAYVIADFEDELVVIDTDPASADVHTVIARIPVASTVVDPPLLSSDGKRAYLVDYHTNELIVVNTDPASPDYHTVVRTLAIEDGIEAAPVLTEDTLMYVTTRESILVIDTALL